jgi:hypothetical protein
MDVFVMLHSPHRGPQSENYHSSARRSYKNTNLMAVAITAAAFSAAIGQRTDHALLLLKRQARSSSSSAAVIGISVL